MIVTSNRDPSEWLQVLADPLHAQALVDRFTNNAPGALRALQRVLELRRGRTAKEAG